MVFLLLALGFGALAYMAWKRRMTTLTRNCRWREDRKAGDWVCAYCHQRTSTSGRPPTVCLDPARDGMGRL